MSVKSGGQVELIFYDFTELGAKVIVNGRFNGLVFRNELFGKYEVGSSATGYVKKVREDGKIDVSLRRGGSHDIAGSKESFLRVLGERGGFLPVTDKTSPEVISEMFRMSKRNFKEVIGSLYKAGIIEITKDGVRLR